MAWTAPPTWAVSEVVTAARMQILSDDLSYVRGLSGAVNTRAALAVTDIGSDITPASLLHLHSTTLAGAKLTLSNAAPVLQFQDNVVNASRTMSGELGFGTAAGHFGGAAGDLNFATGAYAGGQGNAIRFSTASNTAGAYVERFRITGGASGSGGGNVGINQASPQGLIHAVGAGGGFLFFSVNAVDNTLQTLAVAGTVTQTIALWGYDRNNTSAGLALGSGAMLTLGTTYAFVNTDTVTVTLTAGGAITVQRTAGTNGTHQVHLMVMYK
jgi:hypothetical protein